MPRTTHRKDKPRTASLALGVMLALGAGTAGIAMAPGAEAQPPSSFRTFATGLPNYMGMGVVWAGSEGYATWGSPGVDIKYDDPYADNHIYRFTEGSRATRLPHEVESGHIWDHLSLWTGEYLYSFGGRGHKGPGSNEIWRYSPSDDTMRMVADLPGGFSKMCGTWHGDKAYLLGGVLDRRTNTDIIVYDRQRAEATKTGAQTPSGLENFACAQLGGSIYIFGGAYSYRDLSDEIWKFDIASKQLTKTPYKLPKKMFGLSAVSTGDTIILLGGWEYRGEDGTRPAQAALAFDSQGIIDHQFGTHSYLRTPGRLAWTGTDVLLAEGGKIMAWTPPESFERPTRSSSGGTQPNVGEPRSNRPTYEPNPDRGDNVGIPGLPAPLILAVLAVAVDRRRQKP